MINKGKIYEAFFYIILLFLLFLIPWLFYRFLELPDKNLCPRASVKKKKTTSKKTKNPPTVDLLVNDENDEEEEEKHEESRIRDAFQ